MTEMWRVWERLAWDVAGRRVFGGRVGILQGLVSCVDDFGLFPNQSIIYGWSLGVFFLTSAFPLWLVSSSCLLLFMWAAYILSVGLPALRTPRFLLPLFLWGKCVLLCESCSMPGPASLSFRAVIRWALACPSCSLGLGPAEPRGKGQRSKRLGLIPISVLTFFYGHRTHRQLD